jgi:hypothetical protein
MKFHHHPHGKHKVNAYASSKHTNVPFCEQVAILFDIIGKKVTLSEDLYERKEFEKAYHIVKDNINLCTSLCDLLVSSVVDEKNMDNANTWQNFFLSLTQSLVLLSSNHNKERKEKILESVKAMATLWRKRGQEIQEESAIRHIIKESIEEVEEKGMTPLVDRDASVFFDA